MVATFVPLDGRLTSLQMLNNALVGSEVMEIVSPGNAAAGNNFQVTVSALGAFFNAFPVTNTTTITAGATLGSPYNVLTTDTRILFNKTIASDSYAILPLSGSLFYPLPILFKDLKGDASTHPITITFSGGQLCDGLSSVLIANSYGWLTVNPIPGGSGWYLTS